MSAEEGITIFMVVFFVPLVLVMVGLGGSRRASEWLTMVHG